MERRFVIFEDVGSDWKYAKESITESELKRRFSRAAEKYRCYDHPWESVLNVLLHGEGEKELPAKTRDRYRCHLCYYEGSVPCPQHGHLDAKVVTGIQDKPSPSPTRAEWEAWFDESPFHHNPFTMKWFKSMPIVPKGDK